MLQPRDRWTLGSKVSEFKSCLLWEETRHQVQSREYWTFSLTGSRGLVIKTDSFHHANFLVFMLSIILCLFRDMFRAECLNTPVPAACAVCQCLCLVDGLWALGERHGCAVVCGADPRRGTMGRYRSRPCLSGGSGARGTRTRG